MSKAIEPSTETKPWCDLTLEEMLERIQPEDFHVEITWSGGGCYSSPAKWFVKWGHARSTGSDCDLLRALKTAQLASQVGEVRREKHQAKLARRLARKQAEEAVERITE